MPKLIVLIGIPASSKTTYAVDFVSKNREYEYLGSDVIRFQVTGSEGDISQDRRVWEIVDERFDKHISQKDNFVFDTTAYRIKNRKKYIDKAINNGYEVVAVFFNIPLEVCQERNRRRERVVPSFVLENMSKNLVPPSLSEGFKQIITIV